MEEGFRSSVSRGRPEEEREAPKEIDVGLLFGFSPCFGLKLTMAGSMITWFEMCPEVRLGLEASIRLHSNAMKSFLEPSQDPDRKICVRSLVFRTDGNLDASSDEPYMEVCLAGMCKRTAWKRFGSAA